MELEPTTDQGRCPDCGSVSFRNAPHGWVECDNDCGFAILKNHLAEKEYNSSDNPLEDCSDL